MSDVNTLKTKKPGSSVSANLSDSVSDSKTPIQGFEDVSFCPETSVCSATDCTGLIPAMPDSEAELEAYEEMYQFCLKEKDQAF